MADFDLKSGSEMGDDAEKTLGNHQTTPQNVGTPQILPERVPVSLISDIQRLPKPVTEKPGVTEKTPSPSKLIQMYVTMQERAAFGAKAKEAGKTLAGWARGVCRDAAGVERPSTERIRSQAAALARAVLAARGAASPSVNPMSLPGSQVHVADDGGAWAGHDLILVRPAESGDGWYCRRRYKAQESFLVLSSRLELLNMPVVRPGKKKGRLGRLDDGTE